MNHNTIERERERALYFISTSAKNVVSMWDSRKPRPIYGWHVAKHEGKENPLWLTYDMNNDNSYAWTTIPWRERARSISSPLVPKCGFHVGFKKASTNIRLTRGMTRGRREPSTVGLWWKLFPFTFMYLHKGWIIVKLALYTLYTAPSIIVTARAWKWHTKWCGVRMWTPVSVTWTNGRSGKPGVRRKPCKLPLGR